MTGCNFPAYPFENQAETEGFGRMANRMGYEVIGLPNYVPQPREIQLTTGCLAC